MRTHRIASVMGERRRILPRDLPSPRVAFPAAMGRLLRFLAPALVWLGSGISVILLLLSLAADRLRGGPFAIASLPGAVATLVLAAVLVWSLQWRRLDEMRRYLATCLVATLLVFVTRPEAIIGGSVALAGGVVGVLRRV